MIFDNETGEIIANSELERLSIKIVQKTLILKRYENELKALKDEFLRLSNNRAIKGDNITTYKIERPATYDYKGFCKSKGYEPTDEFLKDGGGVSWGVRVTA